MAVLDFNKSYVTISAVVACLGFAVGGTWYVASKVNEVNTAIKGLQRELQEMRDGTVTIPRAAELALRLALANPSLRVPDPRNPDQMLQVNLPR
jgi:hypothetical protein